MSANLYIAVFFLATAADASQISVAQWVFNTLLTLGMAYFAMKDRKFETLEEKNEQKTKELVATQFELHAAKLAASMAELTTRLDGVQQRLERGDESFNHLGERDQKAEVRFVMQMGELKQWVTQNCATREDVKEMNQRFDALQRAVAKSLVSALEGRNE